MTFIPPEAPDAPSTAQPAAFPSAADAFLAWMAAFGAAINAAGGLLQPGDFGLGVSDGSNSPDVVNMDTAPSGFGRISGATAGSKPSGVTSGSVLTLVNQSGRSSQFVFRAASNRVYVRTKHDDVWRAWSEIYCAENILGTVAQSGGVPTGAVVERGSNANGRYVRFADGTQICTHLITGASPSGTSWTYPAAFAFGCDSVQGTKVGTPGYVHFSGPGSTATINVNVRDNNDVQVADQAFVTAIGRWF